MSAKVHRLLRIYVKVTFRHMTYVRTSFKVSYTTLTAAWKYTFIKGYHLLFRCQHLSRAGAGRSTVHHFMTVITSTHLLRRPDSLTCTALHSEANYFLFQAGCCTDSDSDTFSNSVWGIFFFFLKKLLNQDASTTCAFFFSCLIICPNYLVVAKFTYKIKPQSLNQPFSSYAKLTQRDLIEASQNLKRICPVFHCKQFKWLPSGMKQTGNCRCGALLLSKTF